MQTPKQSKIQLPPQKDTMSDRISEEQIKNVISKGGSPVNYVDSSQEAVEVVKNFNVKMTEGDLKMVTILCKKRPISLGRKMSFAKQDWFLEAIREKIEREKKEYNV